MHVYKTNKVGEPTYSAGSPLVKSTYRNDQTIMLYVTDFEAEQFVNNPQGLLNLVLDQTERTKDLYFKVEIFANVDFVATRLGKKMPYRYDVAVPSLPVSGGTPNDPFFYKNPQYLLQLDHTKFVDKQKILSTQVDTILSFTSEKDASVKIYLCKPGDAPNSKGHRGRIFNASEKICADPSEHKAHYK